MMSTILQASDGTVFQVTGPATAPVVVLIHGLGLARGIWDPLHPCLRNYRVICYDLYGHGDSDPVPETATLSLFAGQVARLMDSIGADRAHIVGFSIGGMINRRFAIDHPDRVQSLAILNSPHDRGHHGQAQVEARAAQVRNAGGLSTLPDALKRWFTPEYLVTGAGPAQVTHWRQGVDPESYAQTAWVLAHGVRELIAPKPAISVPALVMTCENDTGSTPEHARAIAAEIPGATCLIVPRLQHLGLMEDPDSFGVPLINFLGKVST